MKSSILCGIAALALAVGSLNAQERPGSTPSSSKPLVVYGRVSKDGMMLLTDIDSAWNIANREAMKGLEGLLVRVKCFVDTENNSIRVLSIRKESGELNYPLCATPTRPSAASGKRIQSALCGLRPWYSSSSKRLLPL